MSGGHFDYKNDYLCHDIFGWKVSANYGDHGFKQSKFARRIDPLDDIIMSELVFDVFCLLHSYDLWQSGDTCEDTYRADVQRFKDKWLKQLPEERIREIVDDELNVVRGRLYNAFFPNGGKRNE